MNAANPPAFHHPTHPAIGQFPAGYFNPGGHFNPAGSQNQTPIANPPAPLTWGEWCVLAPLVAGINGLIGGAVGWLAAHAVYAMVPVGATVAYVANPAAFAVMVATARAINLLALTGANVEQMSCPGVGIFIGSLVGSYYITNALGFAITAAQFWVTAQMGGALVIITYLGLRALGIFN